MNENIIQLTIFSVLLFGGWALEAIYFEQNRTRRRFNLKNYFLFICGPLLAVLYGVLAVGPAVGYMFVLSMFVGAAAEYLADKSYAAIFGANLWRYYRLNIRGSTSWLVLPVWGAAGVAFLLLSRAVFSI